VSEGHNLAAYTTAQNAADVDALRIALGYDQVNLYGGSYGSLLAQATMRDYPAGIRSVVLESVFPLEVSFFLDTTTTVPEAIIQLLDACADDDACNSAYPNLQAVLFEVIDRLNAEPLSVVLTNPRDGQSYDALLTGDAVLGILRIVLYQTPTIPAAPQAIYDLYNGDYTLITQLASTRLAFFGALSLGMEYSMMCAQDLVGRTPEELLEARAALPRQLAGTADPELELQYGIFRICENWPVEQADLSAKEPVISDIPTLLLSGEFDPVTPPAFGRLVAKHLSNGHFYVLPGGGHTGESFGQCALSVTAAFIGDPTDAPDVSCIAKMPGLAFDLPVEAAEIALEPYSNSGMGVSGLVPAGWTEVQPGTFARASSTLDMAALQLALVPNIEVQALLAEIAQGYGLAEMPAPTGERRANGLTWSLYTFEAQGVPRDLAVAESQAGILVLVVRSAVNERDTLYEMVFLPMVDAFMPL
jgi:pimeloyl-ACP methyl ester carboxylesterase